MSHDGPVALITGASRGIGRAVAQTLADEGFRLGLGARSVEGLEELAQAIRGAGGEVYAWPLDVRDGESIAAFAEAAIEQFGRVDLLVANAGIGGGDLFAEAGDRDITAVVETNLIGVLRSVRAVLPQMRRQGTGAIALVASVAGEVALPGSSVYSATKAGLVRFAEGLRREVAGDGIRVTAILPGFVRTDMTREVALPMPGPEVVAKAVWRAYRKGPRRIVVPRFYVGAIWLSRVAPWLPDLVARRMLRDMRRHRE